MEPVVPTAAAEEPEDAGAAEVSVPADSPAGTAVAAGAAAADPVA